MESKKRMKTVIMAGGKGTRISSIHGDIPKPLIKVGGKPIIQRQIELFARDGFNDFIIAIGHMGEQIINNLGDGSTLGVNIEYYMEDAPLGTAGALFKLRDVLKDDFFLINGDLLFDVDLCAFLKYHNEKMGFATILTHCSNHPYDSGIIQNDHEGLVLKWIHMEDERVWYKNQTNAGMHILSPFALDIEYENPYINLDRDILTPLIGARKLYAYKTSEYVYDLGTPKRLEDAENDLKRGFVSRKSIRNKRKAIYIDRDGVINQERGIISDIENFELIEGVSEAIRKINKSGYLVIIITNQPVIARGELTVDGLEEIHNKMETLLGHDGAYVDDIFYCPHHPDAGYDGEVKSLKFDCDCRKPKAGMIIKAAKKYNIDLSNSWMVGDQYKDIEAGKNAGCKTAYIGERISGVESFESLKYFCDEKLDLS